MKMRLLSTVGLCALVLTGILLTLHSCNKNPQTTDRQNDEKELIKAAIAKNGLPLTVPVNQKIEAFYADGAGQRVSTELLRQRSAGANSRTNSIISACDFTNIPTANLNSYAITVTCQQDFRITWNYTISSNNNLALNSPASPAAISKGSVRVTDQSGSTLFTDNNAGCSIVDMGPDNSNPGYELFSVTFNSTFISISLFSTNNTIRLGGTVFSNCTYVEPIALALQPFALNGVNSAVTNPCYRIDPTYIGVVTAPLRVFGEDIAFSCSPFVYPSMQQVQYSIDGGNTWIGESTTSSLSYWVAPPANINTPVKNFINAHLGYVDPTGSLQLQINLSAGPHTVQLRNRNIVYNGTLASYGNIWPLPIFSGPTANCCAGPWSGISSYTVTYQ
jgi:hypothetical protein